MQILEISENGKHLAVSRGHIIVSKNKEEVAKVPIDYILSVVLSAEGTNLTKPFLVRMAEENIPVIICGKNYMPISILTPLVNHSRMLLVVEKQINANTAIKKQLWKQIVKNKIYNQYSLLKHLKPQSPALEKIFNLYKNVRSGDIDNKEAQAARIYFPALFGKGFIRDTEENGINTFLNYSYSIIRATFARAICGSGLLPLLGVKHHNEYNAFCLVDDLMEIARPLADLYVYRIFENYKEITFNPQMKKELLRLLVAPLKVDEQESFLESVSKRYAQAFSNSLTENKVLLPNVELIWKHTLEQE